MFEVKELMLMKFILRLIRWFLIKYMYFKGRYYLKFLNNIGKNNKKKIFYKFELIIFLSEIKL